MTHVHPSRRSRLAVVGTAGVLALSGSVVTALPAMAAPGGGGSNGGGASCDNRNNNTVAKLTDCVTLAGVTEHLEEFQAIADANGDTRASGTPGYTVSADYVEDRLLAAGWKVERQEFQFPFFQELSSSFAQVGPDAATYADGTDYAVMTYSGSSDGVTATAQFVDVVIPPAPVPGSTSGCEAEDFDDFTAGNIALVQRGTCPFGQKVANAEAAGASAVVVFNEGQEGRTDVVQGTLGAPGTTIPAIGVSFALGSSLDGDTIDNVNETVLDQNPDAVAYAVLTLSYDTSWVNQLQGRPVPGGTFQGDPEAREYRQPSGEEVGGGGLSPDHGHDHDHDHGDEI